MHKRVVPPCGAPDRQMEKKVLKRRILAETRNPNLRTNEAV